MESRGVTGRGGSNHQEDPGLLKGIRARDTSRVERPEDQVRWHIPEVKKCEHGVVINDDFDCRECMWAESVERRVTRVRRTPE